jgi:hypothetical protein
VKRREGWNWLGFMPPQVSTLFWEHWILPSHPSSRVLSQECLPGILVWTDPHCRTWLILDQSEGKRDKVYTLAGDEDILRGDDGDDFDAAYLDWFQWLRELWRLIESAAEQDLTRSPTNVRCPICKKPRLATRIPATPWRMRDQAPWKMRDQAPWRTRHQAPWRMKHQALPT